MSVIFRWQADGGATLRTPYDPAFVDDLKKTIPSRHRKWNAEDRLWWVDYTFARDALHLCVEWFGDVSEILHKPPAPPPSTAPSSGAWSVLWLREGAPLPVVEAAYKALARMYHPDLGGETDTMQAVNAAYDQVRSEIEWKD